MLAQDMKPRSPEDLHRLHQDPKADIAMLEDPARDRDPATSRCVWRPTSATAAAYGVDVDPEMVRHLNRRVRDQTKYLALMRKVFKPGGQVIMIDFQKKELPCLRPAFSRSDSGPFVPGWPMSPPPRPAAPSPPR